ncbi:hypothetical protein IscW_ISCW002277 [Ixodes scapularis]|uniref:Secreted protein n=1 Tax=Ixodes scapularis TaxID=6945 RepID=B7PBB0_IXOSC|nr:hypothetical protein IscW_ISCW002277 [Ixodes scapularis]|eukprot:XP_002407878.1 hypothetical protein IscW_ISCW002277 [Ixodes scapularis]
MVGGGLLHGAVVSLVVLLLGFGRRDELGGAHPERAPRPARVLRLGHEDAGCAVLRPRLSEGLRKQLLVVEQVLVHLHRKRRALSRGLRLLCTAQMATNLCRSSFTRVAEPRARSALRTWFLRLGETRFPASRLITRVF